MACFRVVGSSLSVTRLRQSLRASQHDGGASLVQQAPFISLLYLRFGPSIALLGLLRMGCSAVWPSLPQLDQDWGWTTFAGDATLIFAGIMCVFTGILVGKSHRRGRGFTKPGMFASLAFVLFTMSTTFSFLGAITGAIYYASFTGSTVWSLEDMFNNGLWQFWLWTLLYCVLIPITYMSYLTTGNVCLNRMRKMGLVGAGNGTLPLLANAQQVGGYQPPVGGGGTAGGPVLVAVATAIPQNVHGAPVAVPVARAVAYAPTVAAAAPVAKAYAATDVEAAMSG